MRRLVIGRAAKLERLGLAEPAGPDAGTLKLAWKDLAAPRYPRDIISRHAQAMNSEGVSLTCQHLPCHGMMSPIRPRPVGRARHAR